MIRSILEIGDLYHALIKEEIHDEEEGIQEENDRMSFQLNHTSEFSTEITLFPSPLLSLPRFPFRLPLVLVSPPSYRRAQKC